MGLGWNRTTFATSGYDGAVVKKKVTTLISSHKPFNPSPVFPECHGVFSFPVADAIESFMGLAKATIIVSRCYSTTLPKQKQE